MYYLYYAGMAMHGTHEQIGLAISPDGHHFEKVNANGLIIPTDTKLPWKGLRVCNPTVVCHNEQYLMYYMGISSEEPHHSSIGIATSSNGIDFTCQETPCLSWLDMKSIDLGIENSQDRLCLAEPSILIDENGFKMWFNFFKGRFKDGNTLYYADSSDGQKWTVRNQTLLVGNQFGNFSLHYPQVIKASHGYEIWFTLRNTQTESYGIFKMCSSDGFYWTNLEQIYPVSNVGISLTPKYVLSVCMNGRELKASKIFDFVYSKFLQRRFVKQNYFGYAHSHLTDNSPSTIFYHNCNVGSRGLWMNIGRAELTDTGFQKEQIVLTPSKDQDVWDSFFVGDPFVLYTNA